MARYDVAASTLISGASAALASAAVLAAAARARNASPMLPMAATSHWLYGDRAAIARPDGGKAAVGITTHFASAMLWAGVFEFLRRSQSRTASNTAMSAIATSAVAGVVDYGAVPRRITPGWELAVGPRSIAAAFVAMGAGLFAGAVAWDAVSGVKPENGAAGSLDRRLAEARLSREYAAGRETRSAPGDEAEAGTTGTGEDVCPRCGGSGRRDGSQCAHCGGTGRVIVVIGGA